MKIKRFILHSIYGKYICMVNNKCTKKKTDTSTNNVIALINPQVPASRFQGFSLEEVLKYSILEGVKGRNRQPTKKAETTKG